MSIDFERLKALAQAATQGEWFAYQGLVFIYEAAHSNMGMVQSVMQAPIFLAKDMLNDDATFIAAANPAVVLSLVEQLQRAIQQVGQLKTERNQLINERNAALQRAITAEYPSGARTSGSLRTRASDLAPDPDDPLDDVLPLARRHFDRPPIEQMGSQPGLPPLDLLPDSEGGSHD